MNISTTAEQHGFGTDRYKWVSYLTPKERELVKGGAPVYFKSTRLSGGNYGTYWRVAKYINGRFCPRVPTTQEIHQLNCIA